MDPSLIKRFVFGVIVLGAVVYLMYARLLDNPLESTSQSAISEPKPESTAAYAPAPQPVAEVKPAPVAEKRIAAPGVFYMLERISVETKDGVIAAVPGDKVTLLDRRKNGTLKVTNGTADFEVLLSQVTQDLDEAEQAGVTYAKSRRLGTR